MSHHNFIILFYKGLNFIIFIFHRYIYWPSRNFILFGENKIYSINWGWYSSNRNWKVYPGVIWREDLKLALSSCFQNNSIEPQYKLIKKINIILIKCISNLTSFFLQLKTDCDDTARRFFPNWKDRNSRKNYYKTFQ